jgi:hypothetical protein
MGVCQWGQPRGRPATPPAGMAVEWWWRKSALFVIAAIVSCALLPGCAPEAQTESEPEVLARAYLVAVAAGDTATVARVATRAVTREDLDALRLAFFGTRKPLWVGAMTTTDRVAGGVTIAPPLTYMFKVESVIADTGEVSLPRGDQAPTLIVVFEHGVWHVVVAPAGPYPGIL